LLRAAVVIALALGLFGWGSVANASPPRGGLSPTDNPFADNPGQARSQDRGQDGGDPRKASDDRKTSSGADATKSEAGADDEPEEASSSEAEGEEEEEPDSALHGLACLEGDATGGRRKGVQRRDFLKKHRFELAGLGGFSASDALSSTYAYGGALAFYPSEDFGLELLVTRSPMRFRLEEPFSGFDLEHHFTNTTAWQAIGSLLWSPIHAKFKFTESKIVHGDIFALAGAGRTFDATVLGLTWEVGFGLKLYLSRFVTFRLDVRDFLLPQEVLGKGRMTNNIGVLAGVSVWIL
jgi:outer membrane beta-barrel protein